MRLQSAKLHIKRVHKNCATQANPSRMSSHSSRSGNNHAPAQWRGQDFSGHRGVYLQTYVQGRFKGMMRRMHFPPASVTVAGRLTFPVFKTLTQAKLTVKHETTCSFLEASLPSEPPPPPELYPWTVPACMHLLRQTAEDRGLSKNPWVCGKYGAGKKHHPFIEYMHNYRNVVQENYIECTQKCHLF